MPISRKAMNFGGIGKVFRNGGRQGGRSRGGSRAFVRFVHPARARPALWRLGLGLGLVIAAQLGTVALAMLAVSAIAGPRAADLWLGRLAVADTPAAALTLLAAFVPLLVATALVTRILHRRPARTLLGAAVLRDALRGAGVTFAVFALPVAAALVLGMTSANLPLGRWAALFPVALAAIAVQTLAEEALFRGYLTQGLAARFRSPLIWAGLPALTFGALHLDPGRLGAAAPLVMLVALAFGLIATDLTARSGGIGLAWGMHFANNTVGLALIATPGSITGLALRVGDTDLRDLSTAPLVLLAGLAPLLAAWAVLRRRPGPARAGG